MRSTLSAICLIIWSCCAHSNATAAPPGTDQPLSGVPQGTTASDRQIQQWISQLAASEYALRRGAFMNLWEQGSKALPAVRGAAGDSDQQIAATARVLELLLKLEISPRDNAELAELLQMSRVALHRAIMSLSEKGHWRLATELLRSNQAMLDAYRKSGRSEWLCMVVQSAYESGDASKAWPIVQQLLSPIQCQWIAAQAKLDTPEVNLQGDTDARALGLLFRGEFDQAWALGPSASVQQRIIFLSGRWDWLESPTMRALFEGADNKSREGRARLAAYAYLAGDVERSDKLIGPVVEELGNGLAAENADSPAPPDPADALQRGFVEEEMLERRRQQLTTALMICGEGELASNLIPKDKERENLFYFAVRLQYARGLAAFGLSTDLRDYDAWLDKTLTELAPTLEKATPGRGMDDFQQLCELSSFLITLGKTDEGMRLYGKLMDITQRAPQPYRDQTWSYLAVQGRQSQFRPHLVRLLDQRDADFSPEIRRRYFTALYPDWSSIATSLWKTAPPELVQQPAETRATSEADATNGARKQERRWALMERLWRFDRELIAEHPSEPLVESWLKNALRDASQMDDTAPTGATQAIADIALRLGLRSLALSLAKTGTSRSALADVAEIYMREKSFENANVLWEAAISSDPWRHDWILQSIEASTMLGEQEKAQALESSRWLRPLAVDRAGATYWTIAVNLQESGQLAKARDYAYAAFAQQDFEDSPFLTTARTYAEILQELEEYDRCADVHRASNLMLLSEASFGYPLSALQHFVSEEFMARALADLEAGNVDSALDRIRRFELLRPSGIEICEHAYPRLVQRGRQDAADQLLQRCSDRMLKHLDQWPRDAGSHNNLAWMYARCNQRLDDALHHAQLAVELSENAPTYIDTLAETHFRLGHIDEAERLAEKCAALDPRHEHYQKQLHRFRQAVRTPQKARRSKE